MTAKERVLKAFRFQGPDRIPIMDNFWSFPPEWQARFGNDPNALSDVYRYASDECAFTLSARTIREEDGWIYKQDGWGRLIREQRGAYFVETLQSPLAEVADLDKVVFDSPALDGRYYGSGTKEQFEAFMAEQSGKYCVFIKTGGPYLRTTFLRGETQFLVDLASDPDFARALAEKTGAHITAVGIEALKRAGLHDTGIWIYDDMAYNNGPMFSPETFEKILLPAYREMIKAYRAAGAKYVLLHSDGDIRPLLDILIDAGIDGINPVERRAGMLMPELREKYPKLILTGGMCNSDTLINGPMARIEAEAREIIDLGRDGGVVIGTHSISPEVPLEHYAAYRNVCLTYGVYQ